jgi:hypothetical protein
MPESQPPPSRSSSKDILVARLRAWGTLITAIAGLATALLKPQDQTVTKAAYQQCTAGIEKLNDGLAQEHQDLATLRGYVAAKDGQSLLAQDLLPAPPADAGAQAQPPRPTHPPPPRRAQGVPARPAGAAPADTAAMANTAYAPPAPAPSEPPPATPAPAPFHPADFDTVLKNAKF